eukprot:TRINITY_DN5508_c0_g2_i1.p1 TRINITY_DN5508_c0_g2~~TRINITY_DN5508_c0_g2_i1.p1  ORF type:complete len:217 (+),score=61.85 TRINITY_DN5508_c0_g2_i1:67-651(+)
MGFFSGHRRESTAIAVLLIISAVLLFASLGAPAWSDHSENWKIDMYWLKYKLTTPLGTFTFDIEQCNKDSTFQFKDCDFASASKAALSLLTIATIIVVVAAAVALIGLFTRKLGSIAGPIKLVGSIAGAVLTFIATITYVSSFRKNVSDKFAGSEKGETYGPVGWAIALTAGILLTITALIFLFTGRRHGYTKL